MYPHLALGAAAFSTHCPLDAAVLREANGRHSLSHLSMALSGIPFVISSSTFVDQANYLSGVLEPLVLSRPGEDLISCPTAIAICPQEVTLKNRDLGSYTDR